MYQLNDIQNLMATDKEEDPDHVHLNKKDKKTQDKV
jgi:hypothetical protein